MTYDFSGYATKHNIRCSDGRTILPDAFKDCDGTVVPLVWQHMHDSTDNVLGHAQLENRKDGVYAYCSLNDTASGENAKKLIKHGDICALSIYANRLQEAGGKVMHGVIREVSLVLAGANPGAYIDDVAFGHSDESGYITDGEACFSYVGETGVLMHADGEEEENVKKAAEESDKTIGEVIDTMNDEQKAALYAIIESLTGESPEPKGEEIEHAKDDEKKEVELEEAAEEVPEEDKAEKPNEEDDEEEEVYEVRKKKKPSEDFQHADEEKETGSDETIGDVLDTLSPEQKKAVEEILDAISSGKESVSDETKAAFETLNDKQKDAVYAAVGFAAEGSETSKKIEHADESGKTVGDVIETLSDEQAAAVEVILDAVQNNKENVPEDVVNVFNTLSDEQKDAVYAVVGAALDDTEDTENSNPEGEEMKHNVFESDIDNGAVLSHDDMKAIFSDAPRVGSLREAVLQHGIEDIEVLFPEAQAVNNQPYQIARRMEWVSVVLNGVHKSPFSRLKSTAANLTEAQARAKGYVKGRKKIEEQISALKRTTTPQTVYKLQKLDRDDIIDITDFDVVAWMKQEMRMMLDEEIARAILIGDGRLTSDPEKIMPEHIRPVWSDDEMYTIHQVLPSNKATDYTEMIDEIVRSRKDYKGSGTPVMFIGPSILTEMRLLKDQDNKMRYASDKELAEVMRVSAIHEVEVFDDVVRTVEGKDRKLVAIILNLADYTVGATKGGEVSLFDDFDLDYNKYEYLIETRISGALTMPKSAIAIEIQTATDSVADPTYVLVASPNTSDIADYFEQDEYGRYVPTVDSAVVTGKRYYEVEE